MCANKRLIKLIETPLIQKREYLLNKCGMVVDLFRPKLITSEGKEVLICHLMGHVFNKQHDSTSPLKSQ